MDYWFVTFYPNVDISILLFMSEIWINDDWGMFALILLFAMATLNLNGFKFTQMDSIWGKHWAKIGKSHKMSLIHVYGFEQAIPCMRLKWNHLQGESLYIMKHFWK